MFPKATKFSKNQEKNRKIEKIQKKTILGQFGSISGNFGPIWVNLGQFQSGRSLAKRSSGVQKGKIRRSGDRKSSWLKLGGQLQIQ